MGLDKALDIAKENGFIPPKGKTDSEIREILRKKFPKVGDIRYGLQRVNSPQRGKNYIKVDANTIAI